VLLLQVKFGGFSGQGLGTLAWSLARMDIRPKRFWLQVRRRALLKPFFVVWHVLLEINAVSRVW
jgi:hypothetical protein